jgi:hypothetical protein
MPSGQTSAATSAGALLAGATNQIATPPLAELYGPVPISVTLSSSTIGCSPAT